MIFIILSLIEEEKNVKSLSLRVWVFVYIIRFIHARTCGSVFFMWEIRIECVFSRN